MEKTNTWVACSGNKWRQFLYICTFFTLFTEWKLSIVGLRIIQGQRSVSNAEYAATASVCCLISIQFTFRLLSSLNHSILLKVLSVADESSRGLNIFSFLIFFKSILTISWINSNKIKRTFVWHHKKREATEGTEKLALTCSLNILLMARFESRDRCCLWSDEKCLLVNHSAYKFFFFELCK